MKPNKVEFRIPYSDDSGIEFLVTYDSERTSLSDGTNGVITIQTSGESKSEIPISKLNWFMSCMEEIKKVVDNE